MSNKLFVNLPVKNLEKTKEFFSKLGFKFNNQFTDENAACMVLSEDGYVMLLMEHFFKNFTGKELCDTSKSVEVINSLSADSKAAVDEFIKQALLAGGSEPRPAQDHGFMYQRSFQDLDGHLWEVVWMDPSHIQK